VALLARSGCGGDSLAWLVWGGFAFAAMYLGLTWINKKSKYGLLTDKPLL
jgi:hypothetical protein